MIMGWNWLDGYTMSALIFIGVIFFVLMCYVGIRILLDYLNIKKWKA